MGRKIFGAIPDPEEEEKPARAAAPAASVAVSPALGGLREGLRELSANSIREVDPAHVEDDGPSDRLGLDEASIRKLADSIRQHGQQVPILIRPGQSPGRFRVVYGRRRLAALKQLGMPAKAILRHMDDRAAVTAQGQENSIRLDPSFIEKAVFVRDLRAAGYESAVIEEALGIDATTVSRYGVIAETLPDDLIRAIGAAHGSGRRPWMRLAELVRADAGLINALQELLGSLSESVESDERLKAVLDHAERLAAEVPAPRSIDRGQSSVVKLSGGARLGTIRRARNAVTISIDTKRDREFGQWLEEHAERLALEMHQRWLEDGSKLDKKASCDGS